jgi:hypothetical protein
MNKEIDNYYITYENIYNYNDYTKYLILLFIILLLIVILSSLKKYN